MCLHVVTCLIPCQHCSCNLGADELISALIPLRLSVLRLLCMLSDGCLLMPVVLSSASVFPIASCLRLPSVWILCRAAVGFLLLCWIGSVPSSLHAWVQIQTDFIKTSHPLKGQYQTNSTGNTTAGSYRWPLRPTSLPWSLAPTLVNPT